MRNAFQYRERRFRYHYHYHLLHQKSPGGTIVPPGFLMYHILFSEGYLSPIPPVHLSSSRSSSYSSPQTHPNAGSLLHTVPSEILPQPIPNASKTLTAVPVRVASRAPFMVYLVFVTPAARKYTLMV